MNRLNMMSQDDQRHPQPPLGIRVELLPNGLRLQQRMFSPSVFGFSALFIVLFVGVTISDWVNIASGTVESAQRLFSPCVSAALAVLAVVGSLGVYQSLLGQITIELTPEALRIESRHVPFGPGRRSFVPDEIVLLFCRDSRASGLLDLCARARDGRVLELLPAVSTREAALFLRSLLARQLNVREDRSIYKRGEL